MHTPSTILAIWLIIWSSAHSKHQGVQGIEYPDPSSCTYALNAMRASVRPGSNLDAYCSDLRPVWWRVGS